MMIVIANYRTGSSTLIKKLHEETGLKYFSQYTGEWCHPGNGGYKKPDSDIKFGIKKFLFSGLECIVLIKSGTISNA